MTAEERAATLLREWELPGIAEWGGMMQEEIAAAIRDAVTAEREGCAALIGRRGQEAADGFERAADEGDEVYQEAEIETCAELAASIRARGEQP